MVLWACSKHKTTPIHSNLDINKLIKNLTLMISSNSNFYNSNNMKKMIWMRENKMKISISTTIEYDTYDDGRRFLE